MPQVIASDGRIITVIMLTFASGVEILLYFAVALSHWSRTFVFLILSEMKSHGSNLFVYYFSALPKAWSLCMRAIIWKHWKALSTGHLVKCAERISFPINIRLMNLTLILIIIQELTILFLELSFILRVFFRIILFLFWLTVFQNWCYESSFIFNSLNIQFLRRASENEVNISFTLDVLVLKTFFKLKKSAAFNNFSSPAFNRIASIFK